MNTKKIKISELQIGMKIKTKDEYGNIVFKTVSDKFNTVVPKKDQVRLEFENGTIINCSTNHPIMVSENDTLTQRYPEQLMNDDVVITDTGNTRLVHIDVGQENDENYIDITVENLHTFFTAESLDGDMVLTHNSQGSVRGASCTASFPGWHLEFERLIELKNNKGTDETRIRTMDYSIALNETLYKRLVTGGNITLFSPEEVPDLYEAFYSNDIQLFEELYTKYETNKTITKKSISAEEFFTKIMNERFETGRIYIINADNMNMQTPFYENIYQSNLCLEIAIPAKSMGYDDSLISLCTLGAINWGKFSNNLSEKEEAVLKDCCQVLVRGLDSILSYQEYPVEAAKVATEMYRPLGIGIIGYAHWLAKSRTIWGSDEALCNTETIMEKQAYYLTEASIDLAKEFGPIKQRTRYADGIVPRDLAKIPVNSPLMDWDFLKTELLTHGIRNGCLMALMPSETSSTLANATNGIEPPRNLITIKGSKDGVLPQVVPDYLKLNNIYETLWNVDVQAYLKTVAVFQKYVDQSISTNTSYDPAKGEITMAKLIEDLILAYKLGIKTLYYCQTNDNSGEEIDSGCESGACKL